MGGLIDSIGSFVFGGDEGDASIEAAGIQTGIQRETLEYLKERERFPQGYREEALKKLIINKFLLGGHNGWFD